MVAMQIDHDPPQQLALFIVPDKAPALVWTPAAQQLYHRIKAELWPGDALVQGKWRLELYQPERLHFKAVERRVVACSHTTRQGAWWGRTAWFKHKYRALPWTPGRRFWTKREVMGKPYFRLVCGLREVCIEHVDPARQNWLQKQFAMYLAAKGVTAQKARVMLLPIALDRDVEPVRARGKRTFEHEAETVQLERVNMTTIEGHTEKVTTTVYVGNCPFELEIRVQEQGVLKGGQYLILGTDTATGMMVSKAVALTGFADTAWRVLEGSFVPDVYQVKEER